MRHATMTSAGKVNDRRCRCVDERVTLAVSARPIRRLSKLAKLKYYRSVATPLI